MPCTLNVRSGCLDNSCDSGHNQGLRESPLDEFFWPKRSATRIMTLSFQPEHLTIETDEVRIRLLPLLREQVFHVTSRDRFHSIESSGIVNANKDGIFGNTYHRSAGSFARNHGFVCLFDLRNQSEEAIDWGLFCFDNLIPSQLGDDFVFLILSAESYPRIMCWGDPLCPTDHCGQRIPQLECWYPRDMPLSEINRVLFVHVNRSVPPPDSLSVRMAAVLDELWSVRPPGD